jgi:cytochrome b involved in lipid metabolism
MMKNLFLTATSAFWLAIAAFAVAGTTSAPSPSAPTATTPNAKTAEKRFSMVEVARHAVEADCWMAINGGVYDLTTYLPDHPSRPNIVLPWCGKEATEAYKTKTKGRPHSTQADQMLPTYRIGALEKP